MLTRTFDFQSKLLIESSIYWNPWGQGTYQNPLVTKGVCLLESSNFKRNVHQNPYFGKGRSTRMYHLKGKVHYDPLLKKKMLLVESLGKGSYLLEPSIMKGNGYQNLHFGKGIPIRGAALQDTPSKREDTNRKIPSKRSSNGRFLSKAVL